MTGAGIACDEDGYALTPEGQAWKLWVAGAEPAAEADREWFGAFNVEARQDEIFARIEAEAERTDQENRGIPWTDSPSRDQEGPYDCGPWRTWPLPAAHDDPATRPHAEPEAEA
jgi:hypothetical protein